MSGADLLLSCSSLERLLLLLVVRQNAIVSNVIKEPRRIDVLFLMTHAFVSRDIFSNDSSFGQEQSHEDNASCKSRHSRPLCENARKMKCNVVSGRSLQRHDVGHRHVQPLSAQQNNIDNRQKAFVGLRRRASPRAASKSVLEWHQQISDISHFFGKAST